VVKRRGKNAWRLAALVIMIDVALWVFVVVLYGIDKAH
jgi:hypothetical protein